MTVQRTMGIRRFRQRALLVVVSLVASPAPSVGVPPHFQFPVYFYDTASRVPIGGATVTIQRVREAQSGAIGWFKRLVDPRPQVEGPADTLVSDPKGAFLMWSSLYRRRLRVEQPGYVSRDYFYPEYWDKWRPRCCDPETLWLTPTPKSLRSSSG